MIRETSNVESRRILRRLVEIAHLHLFGLRQCALQASVEHAIKLGALLIGLLLQLTKSRKLSGKALVFQKLGLGEENDRRATNR